MRYGHQSISEIDKLTAAKRQRIINALSALIKTENNIVGGAP